MCGKRILNFGLVISTTSAALSSLSVLASINAISPFRISVFFLHLLFRRAALTLLRANRLAPLSLVNKCCGHIQRLERADCAPFVQPTGESRGALFKPVWIGHS